MDAVSKPDSQEVIQETPKNIEALAPRIRAGQLIRAWATIVENEKIGPHNLDLWWVDVDKEIISKIKSIGPSSFEFNNSTDAKEFALAHFPEELRNIISEHSSLVVPTKLFTTTGMVQIRFKIVIDKKDVNKDSKVEILKKYNLKTNTDYYLEPTIGKKPETKTSIEESKLWLQEVTTKQTFYTSSSSIYETGKNNGAVETWHGDWWVDWKWLHWALLSATSKYRTLPLDTK